MDNDPIILEQLTGRKLAFAVHKDPLGADILREIGLEQI